ncbi:OBAP family protein [Kineococcus sp. G2]|uniref:OBAP family protein n=1 Tax=Kineococcus sp. G2 TaxID=3127484 RepID=UPI00301C5574
MKPNPAIQDRPSPVTAAGARKGAWLTVLDAGARLLQSTSPLKGFDVYVAGLHCAKGDPGMQMEAHHYCKVVNDDLLQCLIFDGNTADANLIGIEYIVSGALFDTLPEEEKDYWHPHNYEVFSGQLSAPGLPQKVETSLMKQLVNSYGKTWHTWHTGTHGAPGMDLPMGDATLMWSFNRDGEADEGLRTGFEQAMGIDSDAKRADRASLLPLAEPQRGVDEMKDDFTGTTPVPGVVDADAPR